MKSKNRYLASTFVYDMTFNFGRSAMPLVALSLTTARGNQADYLLTIFAGVMMLAPAIGAPLAGKAGDRMGFPACLVIASGLLAVVFLGLGRVNGLVPLGALGFLMGISAAFFYPCVEGAIAGEAPRGKLTPYMGQYNLTWAASATVGTTLAGIAFSRFGTRSFWGGSAVAAALFVALIVNLAVAKIRKPEFVELPGTDLHPPEEVELFRKASLIANFALGGLMAVLLALGVTLTETSAELQIGICALASAFRKAHGAAFADMMFKGSWRFIIWSLLIGAFSVAKLGAFVLMSLTDVWEYRMRVLVGTQIVACLAAFVLVASGELGVQLAAFALIGAASGITYFSSIYYSERAGASDVGGREDRGAKSGWHEGILAAGAGCALVLAGFSDMFFSLFGLKISRAPFAFGGLLVAFTLAAQFSFLKRRKRVAAAP